MDLQVKTCRQITLNKHIKQKKVIIDLCIYLVLFLSVGVIWHSEHCAFNLVE